VLKRLIPVFPVADLHAKQLRQTLDKVSWVMECDGLVNVMDCWILWQIAGQQWIAEFCD
jgi:hypothetical protein